MIFLFLKKTSVPALILAGALGVCLALYLTSTTTQSYATVSPVIVESHPADGSHLEGRDSAPQCATLPQAALPMAPYRILVATFEGENPDFEMANRLAWQLNRSQLPKDMMGNQVEAAPVKSKELDGWQVVLGGFWRFEVAQAYAVQLVSASPDPLMGMSFDGFRLMEGAEIVQFLPGEDTLRTPHATMHRGLVVRRKAPVFSNPDPKVPPLSTATAILDLNHPVLLVDSKEVCGHHTEGCLYWYQVLHGEDNRRGWIPSSDLVDLDGGLRCPDRGCSATAFLRRIGRDPALTSGDSGPVRYDMYLQRGRRRSLTGRFVAHVQTPFQPELRWREGRPVVVHPDGDTLHAGPQVGPKAPASTPSRRKTS